MKIAIPIDEKDTNNLVSVSFGRAPYYLIYDTESKAAEYIENTAASYCNYTKNC